MFAVKLCHTSARPWSRGQIFTVDDDFRRSVVVIGTSDVDIFHLRRPVGHDDLLDLIAEEIVEAKGGTLSLFTFFTCGIIKEGDG